MVKGSVIAVMAAIGIASVLAGCQQDSAPEQIRDQYDADFQAKKEELQPMVGVFEGKVHLFQMDQDFDCRVILDVTPEIENSPQSEDPSQSIEIAKLGGSIAFPTLQALADHIEDLAGFQQLWNPLDRQAVVTVAYGDYNPNLAEPVTLPYLAQDQKTVFGRFQGRVSGDEFTGTWFAYGDFGDVGTFDLHRTSDTPNLENSRGNAPRENSPRGNSP